MDSRKSSKRIVRIVLGVLLPIVVLEAVAGIVYSLIVYDSKLSTFFDSPLNLIIAIALLVVFSVLVVVINLMNNGGGVAIDGTDSSVIDVSIKDNGKSGDSGQVRFGKLAAIDEVMESYKKPDYNMNMSLSEICEGFRNYAAFEHGLYYDYPTVRSFIAGLAVNKLIIMQGISGTGKTSMAWVFGEYIGHSSSIIPVQPSWRERTDLLGYFNEFTRNFNETEFLKVLYEASYTDDVCVTVLDEMNIARVEYYFAEFLSLLELKQTDNWMIDVVSSGWKNDPKKIVNGRFKLPENMWYIGTANNDDSTMAISDKVYDRAMVMDLNNRAQSFEAPATEAIKLSFSRFKELVAEASKEYRLSERGKANIAELDKYMADNLGITFGNRIMRQLEEFVPVYLSCGGTESEAIDIIMARKVLRKLEAKNPLFVKRQTKDFLSFIDGLFGENVMVHCEEVLNKYDI